MGYVRANRSSSRSHPHTICGESDDVAQVSKTSGSAAKPPGSPRCDSSNPGGVWEAGSTGRAASSAKIGSSWSSSPSASRRYQTGNGMPKNRWREMSQSPFRPSIQLVNRDCMYAGTQVISSPRATSAARRSASRPPLAMYHCRVETISSGLSPRS